MFDLLSPELILFAAAVTFLGGFVKGAIGFAIPLIMISGMSILIDPKIVIAGMVVPLLVSNLLQVWQAGLDKARIGLRQHWRFVVPVCVMILISAQFVTRIPPEAMYVVLGVPVVTLCLVQLAGWRPRIAARFHTAFAWAAGSVAGVLGGLAGTWGPPTVLYLLALDTPRDRQMAIQGVIYGLGSVMLFAAHLKSGILNAQTWWFSAFLVIPAALGMWFGFRAGDRLDADKFRKATLLVLVIAGFNLIRRGLL